MNEQSVVVSSSIIGAWRHCERSYYERYVLNLTRKKPKVTLFRGTIIHEMIKAYHRGDKWKKVLKSYLKEYDKLFKEEREEFGDLPTELPRIMRGYIKRWKRDGLKTVLLEEKLGPIELKNEIYLEGTLDRIVEDRQGNQWIFDTKTHKKFPTEEQRQMKFQPFFYVWLARKAGYKPVGIIWDYIRTKTPTVPEQLKSGELTRRKNIDTTREVYLQEIERLNLDPNNYREELQRLEGNEENFYQRVYQPISDSAIRKVISDAYREGLRIRKYGNKPIRQLNWRCDQCEYWSLCRAELYDMDREFIVKNEYQPKERNDNGDNEDEE